MRRYVWTALGLLLMIGGLGIPATGQRGAPPPVLAIEPPRPSPVLPVALVPFTIGPEACQKGRQPVVAFKVYNVLAKAEATLRLRTRRFENIDGLRLRCGKYVAIWDGTIDGGTRLARPGLYYLRLSLDDSTSAVRQVQIPEP